MLGPAFGTADTPTPGDDRRRVSAWPVASIRRYLICLSLAIFLPAFAFAGLLSTRLADAERRIVEAQRTDITSNLDYLIDREIGGIVAVLRGLTASPDLAALRFNQFQGHADAAAKLSRLEQIVLTDRRGQPVAPVAASTGGVLVDPDVLETVFAGRTHVSDMRLGPPGIGFVVSIPVAVNGVIDHALSAIVSVDSLRPLFAQARLGDRWIAAIVDRKGTVLARSRAAERFVGLPASPAVVGLVSRAASEGQFDNVSLDGTPVVNSFRRSTFGWTSLVAVPTDILHASRNRALWVLGVTGIGLALLGLGLATLLGNRIAWSARELRRAALDVVQGRRPADVVHPIAELREVTAVFDFAAATEREREATEDRLRTSEERLRLAVEAGAFGTWDLDLTTGQARWSEKAFLIFGYPLEPSGRASIGMWRRLLLPEDRATAIADADRAMAAHERYESEHRIIRADTGEISWVRKTGQFYYDGAGTAVRSVGVIRDITQRKAIEAELLTSQARYKSALALGRIGSWETNFETGQRLWSDEGQALFRLQLKDGVGQVSGAHDEFRAALHPDDRHFVDRFYQLAQALDSFDVEYRIIHPDGNVIWVAGRGQVVARNANGKATRLISVVGDITQRKTAEQHVTFLMGEISHRSKNLIAVIQAIASRTMRSATSMKDFETRFRHRLNGIAASNDILITQNWQRAPLVDLAREQLAPFIDIDTARVQMTGPSVTVDASAAQAIGLALHELATNAAKYGALSTPTGRVDITWAYTGSDRSEIVMDWLESGGPPVSAPATKGFGHTVIEQMAAQAVCGTVTLEFAATGVRWSLRWPATPIYDAVNTTATGDEEPNDAIVCRSGDRSTKAAQ